MPKTLADFIADRQKTGNIVYEQAVPLSLKRDSVITKSFTIKTPTIASWSTVVHFSSTQILETSISFMHIPATELIASNFEFSLMVGDLSGPSGALKSTEEKIAFKQNQTTKFHDYYGSFVTTMTMRIKYVGHPRMRNKLYNPICYDNPATPFFTKFMDNSVLSDFKFIVKGKEFKVHKSVLASASSMLLKMFTVDMAENKDGCSKIDHIEPGTFENMLKFIYGIEVSKDVSRRDLYIAAHYFQVESLKAVCEQEVHTSLDFYNAIDIFMWAYPYDELEGLKYDAWDVIKKKTLSNLIKEPFETVNFEVIKKVLENFRILKESVHALSKK